MEGTANAERIVEREDDVLVPRPLPSLSAAAELREAIAESDLWEKRLMNEDASADELRAAAKGLASATQRVVSAFALVGAEGGVLALQTRDDQRPRFVH